MQEPVQLRSHRIRQIVLPELARQSQMIEGFRLQKLAAKSARWQNIVCDHTLEGNTDAVRTEVATCLLAERLHDSCWVEYLRSELLNASQVFDVFTAL